jgi:hypothetical protein
MASTSKDDVSDPEKDVWQKAEPSFTSYAPLEIF